MTTYSDADLKRILTQTRHIALVGASPNPVRASHFVGRYLSLKGFDVYPVNPGHVGELLFGHKVAASLDDIDAPVDMVDIFRRAEAVPEIVDAAMARFETLKTVWMQIGIEHPQSAARAEAAGLRVVQNRCPKIEHQRLFGELRKAGFVTGIISSRL